MSNQPVLRFSNVGAQRAGIALGIFFGLLGIPQLGGEGSLGLGISFILLGTVFAVRSRRSSELELSDSGIKTRLPFSSRRIPYSDLVAADVAVGRTGLGGFNREYVLFTFKDGRTRPFRDLNCPAPLGPDAETVVREAVRSINSRLRTPPNPSP